MTEEEVREELMALLRYANCSEIARELGVTPQAVINWQEGRNVSPHRLLQVRRLYGLPDTTKEPPEPVWLEGLAGGIAGKVIAELTTSRADELRQLVDDLELRLGQRSEAPPVRTDTADRDG